MGNRTRSAARCTGSTRASIPETLIAHICPEVREGDDELTLFWRAVRDSADVYVEMLERLERGERLGQPQREKGRLYQVKTTWLARRAAAGRADAEPGCCAA